MKTRILLADDHKLMRQGLRSLIEQQGGMEVVAEAEDGRDAVKKAVELSPNVVIMDIGMPELNGIEATRQIIESVPDAKVIALSMHAGERMVVEMLKAGASAYVLKLSCFEELSKAIDAVISNERYLSPDVAGVVMDAVARGGISSAPSAFSTLTSREREVLQLLVEGKNSKQIAFDLGISARTVDVHRKNTMDKLGIDSVAELTRYAIREGLIEEN